MPSVAWSTQPIPSRTLAQNRWLTDRSDRSDRCASCAPLNHQEPLNGKSSQKSLHDCMTPSETFGKFFACSALYAFFLLFSSLGPIRPSGGFSDLQKRQDFEGRAPRRHKTVGFGTCGSPTTIRFKQNSRLLFFKTRPSTTRRNDQYCILRLSDQCKGKCWSRLIPV